MEAWSNDTTKKEEEREKVKGLSLVSINWDTLSYLCWLPQINIRNLKTGNEDMIKGPKKVMKNLKRNQPKQLIYISYLHENE